MNFAWNYIFVLCWLAYIIASGVFLFSRGFLLSRVSKTDVASCRHLSLNSTDNYYLSEEMVQEIFKDVNATTDICLPQKSKVIILVIDALKYEFGLYRENLTDPLPYENKLTVLHELMQTEPANSRVMRFKADPPTTTLQRLKGLTTGSLPTFIDIGSNFASPEINEDNIIDQMVHSNLSVVFLGDSTWTDLYPRRFKRSYAYPSFDIFDLDTVDRKIQKHLPAELDKSDWQVLIAHFLGVDHCGHKHGPMHKEMARKLTEMNEMIKSVIAKMDNATTLLIMGDHGMTASGDHGGDSDDETNALLFAYTKHNKFVSIDVGSDNETLQQIDLVPTLATILGIPIPYSNLGLINFHIVPDVEFPYMKKFQGLLLHAWQNSYQIHNYFFNYALENKRTFNVDEMGNMETEFVLLSHRVKTIYNEVAFKSFTGDLNKQIRLVLTTCREIWVKFDPDQMAHGLLVTIIPIFLIFLLINQSRPMEFYNIFTWKVTKYTFMINLAAFVFGYRYFKYYAFKTEEHGAIFFTNIISTLILVFLIIQRWTTIATNWSNVQRFDNMPTRLLLVASMSIYFSNSFIIQEAQILSYLLMAIILLLVYEVLQKSIRVDFRTKFKPHQFLKSTAFILILTSILAIVFIRFAYTLFRCREEQGNCGDFTNNAGGFSLKKSGSATTYIFVIIIIVLYTTLTRIYLRSCGNLTGSSINVILARYGPTIASICAGGHILLANSAIKTIKRSHIDAMALVIYALLLLQILVVTYAPLMVYVLPPKTSTINVGNNDSIVPEIFKKMRRMYEGGDDESPRDSNIPIVYGLATVYSATLISFASILSMVLIILLEPKSSMGILICMAVGAIIITIHSILRYRTSTNFESCIQPSFTAIVCWFLLAHFCFFATSHQTTLSQIDWRAAFVGRTTSLGQSTFISGIMVILNTFGGQILFFGMYGLLSTETFSIFALFPNLIKSNYNRDIRKLDGSNVGNTSSANNGPTQPRTLTDISNDSVGFDITRGELILFENEAIFLGATFKLAAQFMMLQSIKVFCAMIACTIHCRHLMVWKIFAPRFIYEGIATFVSFPAIIIGYLLIMRIHLAVDRLVMKISSKKNN